MMMRRRALLYGKRKQGDSISKEMPVENNADVRMACAGLIPRGKKRTLSIVCATYPLVMSGKLEIPGVEVSYQGKEVDDLSITRFSFWNSGKRAFMKSDLAYGEVIRLYWDESIELFDAQLIKVTDESNKLRLDITEGGRNSENTDCDSQGKNNLSIKFDYMNRGDGAILQVIHTGDAKNIRYKSKLKDGKVVLESEYFNEFGHIHSPSQIESINLKTVFRVIACGFTIIGMDIIFIFTLFYTFTMSEVGGHFNTRLFG